MVTQYPFTLPGRTSTLDTFSFSLPCTEQTEQCVVVVVLAVIEINVSTWSGNQLLSCRSLASCRCFVAVNLLHRRWLVVVKFHAKD